MASNSLANQVYTSLREAIIEGSITANDILTEKKLAEQYNVSKAPIREALHRLCQEGYLNSYPRKGYMVNEISQQECCLMQQFRYYMESAAIGSIVDKASDEQIRSLYAIIEEPTPAPPKEKNPYKAVNTQFHLAMAQLVDNHYLADTLRHYVGSITRVVIRYPALAKLQKKEDHAAIVDALLARDRQKAIDLLYDDLSALFPFER